ncbi:MAG: hypothetical protein A2039_05770 [Candidatus Melainabacteria bacterium GWA2_34_9]|nr:MAG: hypothetical protein A2039_05770 [Candidatus Melainabacteria bacterium GWA2_34_9]
MINTLKVTALILAITVATTISNVGICANTAVKDAKASVSVTNSVVQYEAVDPLALVANPQSYLNKKIKMIALFDKFSTIGLDYPPVKKSSKDYISFIIKRPDVENKGQTIPLSELKFIIKRDKAEKLIDLESGDKIEIKGTVFSTALGDPWVDVDEVKILEPKPTPAKKANK